MREERLADLISPVTGHPLQLQSVSFKENSQIKEGILVDRSGKHVVPIRNFIPRFVEGAAYTDSFGEQWNRYRQVQLDRENNFTLSADRFYKWTGWNKDELRGLRILEVGCGAGRFTQVMLEAGAEVYAFDISSSVDACWDTNRLHKNLCLLQADLYQIPYAPGFFDRVFCYGVLQHTPDPQQAFTSLIPFLRPGGKISIDCYIKEPLFTRWTSKYLWRPITTRLPSSLLLKIIEWYIPKWLPIDTRLARIPGVGKKLVGIIPCWNYTNIFPLQPNQVKLWAILDTFDALASTYDKPQTVQKVREWFYLAELSDIQVQRGSNGIVGNAVKP